MPEYFEFDVRLSGITPKIWRRFLIDSEASFMELHDAIQSALGWGHCHLFVFQDEPGGEVLAEHPDSDPVERGPDANDVKLASYFGSDKNTRCTYLYDFGDCWDHEVKFVGIVKLDEKFHRRLLSGARACPPEDCGGVHGYKSCVRAVKGGADREGLRDWLPAGWHPENFDVERRKGVFDEAEPPDFIF
jgi:hypothetical protein